MHSTMPHLAYTGELLWLAGLGEAKRIFTEACSKCSVLPGKIWKDWVENGERKTAQTPYSCIETLLPSGPNCLAHLCWTKWKHWSRIIGFRFHQPWPLLCLHAVSERWAPSTDVLQWHPTVHGWSTSMWPSFSLASESGGATQTRVKINSVCI